MNKKDKIRRILWERNFSRKLQEGMVENAVGSYREEYLGIGVETDTTKIVEMHNRNNVFHAMVKMLTAFMMTYVFDKCIDEIVEIIEKEEDAND